MNILFHFIEQIVISDSLRELLDRLYAFINNHYKVRRCAFVIKNNDGEWVHERVYGFTTESIFSEDSYTKTEPTHKLEISYRNEKIGEMHLYDEFTIDKEFEGITLTRLMNVMGYYVHYINRYLKVMPLMYETPDYLKERIKQLIQNAGSPHEEFSISIAEIPFLSSLDDRQSRIICNELTLRFRIKMRGQDEIIFYGGKYVSFILPETGEKGRIYLEPRILSIIEQLASSYEEENKPHIAGATYPSDGRSAMELVRKIDGRLGFDPHSLIPKIYVKKTD